MSRVHVAVGVILAEQRVLLSLRHPDSHQGGLWEFPGGKLEPVEGLEQALARELLEELDIHIGPTEPLLQVQHDYSDKQVLLDVHLVLSFSGEPRGCEGQALRWVSGDELRALSFPAANEAIIDALEHYLQQP